MKKRADYFDHNISIFGTRKLSSTIHNSVFRGVRKIAKKKISFVTSVCPSVRLSAWNNSTRTEQIFMKFTI